MDMAFFLTLLEAAVLLLTGLTQPQWYRDLQKFQMNSDSLHWQARVLWEYGKETFSNSLPGAKRICNFFVFCRMIDIFL